MIFLQRFPKVLGIRKSHVIFVFPSFRFFFGPLKPLFEKLFFGRFLFYFFGGFVFFRLFLLLFGFIEHSFSPFVAFLK